MNHYDKNLASLMNVRPLLYEQYRNYQEKNIPSKEEVASLVSRDEHLFMTVKKDGMEYRLNSNYRPMEEASRWSQQFEFHNIGIVVEMFGLGNGYFIRELQKKLRNGDRIIVVEPDYTVFHHVLENYDITDILEDVRISITVSELSSVMFHNLINQYVYWMNIKSQIVCVHPQYEKCYPNELQIFIETLKENNNRTLINRNTESYFGYDLVMNTIENYRYVPESNYLLEYVDKIPTDVPAIIVAAGPSLDKNIDLLKEAKGKAIIIATDTALRYLKKHGIKADFAVTLDPRKPPEYFDDTDFEWMPMFCDVEANAKALRKHKGKKIWFYCHKFIDRFYQTKGHRIYTMNPGGSVATAAFSICVTLNFKTIVLIGQDLAYKGEITHAEGEICRVQSEEEGICFVEGIDGNPIKTRHDWNIYRRWFERSIEELNDRLHVIDATEGGAKIHGTDIMTLREVIDQYCNKEIDIPSIINQVPTTFRPQEQEELKQYFHQAIIDLDAIEKKSKRVIALCNQCMMEQKKVNSTRLNALGKEIIENNESVANYPVYLLIDDIIKHNALKQLQKICVVDTESKEDRRNTYANTKEIFQSICNAVLELREKMSEEEKTINLSKGE